MFGRFDSKKKMHLNIIIKSVSAVTLVVFCMVLPVLAQTSANNTAQLVVYLEAPSNITNNVVMTIDRIALLGGK